MENDIGSDISAVAEFALSLVKAVDGVFVDSPQAVRLAVLGLLSGLHVLVEDIPGVGKTTLALALSRAAGLDFSRIQFKPDMLPGDVLGMNVWDGERREFVYKAGPIAANFVLADELNRASPRTQSAFLEAMQEGRTTVDGRTIDLPSSFFMMATQNPQNFGGTFRLPEAEPSRSAVERARRTVLAVHVAPALRDYIVSIARSTRGSFSIPEDVEAVAPAAFAGGSLCGDRRHP
jgi:MoxR-like ATPase